MKKSVATGVFFVCGILAGTLLTAYYNNSSSVEVEHRISEVVASHIPPTIASEQMNSAYLANLTLELSRLREAVQRLNVTRNDTKIIYVEKAPRSHADVQQLDTTGPQEAVVFDDQHVHQGDDRVAKEMYDKVRVLCWVMTSPDTLRTKAIQVKTLWGKRCNKLIFMSDIEDKEFPAVGLGTDLGRDHLTAKTMRAFDYVYKNHFDDADWFMKADDDTYVILENLRYLLSAHAPTESVYFGHHFKVIVRQGYFSGGAGYVLSKEALKRFANRDPTLCPTDHGDEDIEIGRCMERLSVKTGDSRDKLGRSRFHCFDPVTHLHGPYPDWYPEYNKYGAKMGIESISDNPISFHYLTPKRMYTMEYFVYHLNAYGIVNGLQDLNGPVAENSTSGQHSVF